LGFEYLIAVNQFYQFTRVSGYLSEWVVNWLPLIEPGNTGLERLSRDEAQIQKYVDDPCLTKEAGITN
jgi:hypothetical protein